MFSSYPQRGLPNNPISFLTGHLKGIKEEGEGGDVFPWIFLDSLFIQYIAGDIQGTYRGSMLHRWLPIL